MEQHLILAYEVLLNEGLQFGILHQTHKYCTLQHFQKRKTWLQKA